MHRYCPKCENDCFEKQGTAILKSLVTLIQKQNAEVEISKQITDLLTPTKMISNASNKNKMTVLKYSQNLHLQKKNVAKHIPSTTQRERKPLKKKRDLNIIVIVSGSQKYRKSIEIKRAFSKVFPIQKNLSVAFNTVRANIFLKFSTSQEADEVFSSWKLDYPGPKTILRKTIS